MSSKTTILVCYFNPHKQSLRGLYLGTYMGDIVDVLLPVGYCRYWTVVCGDVGPLVPVSYLYCTVKLG